MQQRQHLYYDSTISNLKKYTACPELVSAREDADELTTELYDQKSQWHNINILRHQWPSGYHQILKDRRTHTQSSREEPLWSHMNPKNLSSATERLIGRTSEPSKQPRLSQSLVSVRLPCAENLLLYTRHQSDDRGVTAPEHTTTESDKTSSSGGEKYTRTGCSDSRVGRLTGTISCITVNLNSRGPLCWKVGGALLPWQPGFTSVYLHPRGAFPTRFPQMS